MGESEDVKRVGRGEEVVTWLLFRRKLLTFELSRRPTQSGNTENSGALDGRLERKVRYHAVLWVSRLKRFSDATVDCHQ
jgi:hypothetical protein